MAQMVQGDRMRKLQVWGCDYCSMVSRHKASVVRHEKHYCRNSPERTTCWGCINMEYEPEDRETGEYPVWYCTAKEKDLGHTNLNANIDCEKFKARGIG